MDGRHQASRRTTRIGRAMVATGTATALASVGFLAGPGTSGASSHREAPLIAGDPRADNTDTYAFVSPDDPDKVTLIANWIPFEEPNGGPNFYAFATDARYNIYVDNNGDGVGDVTYRWQFTDNYRDAENQFLYNTGPVKSLDDPNLNFFQTYTLTKVIGDGQPEELITNAVAAPSLVGPASIPDYAALRSEAIKPLPDGGQTYVGQADDPFFIDLRVFDLLYGGDLSEVGNDTLAGYNVNTIAIQVPKSDLAINGNPEANPVIGVWSTTDRRGGSTTEAATEGEFTQVSRLGNPLVNEVVVPIKHKDAFNGLTPDKDHTVQPVVDKVLDPILPKLIQNIYDVPAPPTPRNDLFEIFLTGICKTCAGPNGEVAIPIDLNSQQLNADGLKGGDFVPAEELRLNMSIAPTAEANRLGVLAKDLAGFPNGRRLGDDVVDIAIQAVEGAAQSGQLVEALAAGDVVNSNDLSFGSSFPYVALPHSDSVNRSSGGGGSAGASGSGAGGNGAPAGAVGAGYGGLAEDEGFPAFPVAAIAAGVLLAGAGVLVRSRERADA